MDELDYKLLKLLQRDATLSYAELGGRVGLSTSAINERLKKLRTSGVIMRQVAVLDPQQLQLGILAFVQVGLADYAREEEFRTLVQRWAAVQECHHLAGEYAYLLKVRVRDMQALELFLRDKLKASGLVARTHTTLALSSQKETQQLPIGDE